MTDRVLPSLDLTAEEGVEVVRLFREKLDGFVAQEKCEMYRPATSLFPYLMARRSSTR